MDLPTINIFAALLVALVTVPSTTLAIVERIQRIRERRRNEEQRLALIKADAKIEQQRQKLYKISQAAEFTDDHQIWTANSGIQPFGYYEFIRRSKLPIFTIANFKGGVGKTTLAAYLARFFASRGHRVLLIDLDYQGSLSSFVLNGEDQRLQTSGADFLLQEGSPGTLFELQTMSAVRVEGGADISLVTAARSLAILENRLTLRFLLNEETADIRYRLAAKLFQKRVEDSFDIVLIDTPPRMTPGTINALLASSHVIIPTSLYPMSREAVPPFANLLQTILPPYNPRLQIAGVVISLTHQQTGLIDRESQQFYALRRELAQVGLADSIYQRFIPRKVSIADGEFENQELLEIFSELGEQILETIPHKMQRVA